MRLMFVFSLLLSLCLGSIGSPSWAARRPHQPPPPARRHPAPPPPARPIVPLPQPEIAPPPPPATPLPPPQQEQPIPKRPKTSLAPQFGIAGGYIAGLPGVLAEVRFHNPFELVATALRIGAGYAVDGSTRKHALLTLDAMYKLTAPDAPGFRSYVGLGVNFDAYTTGRQSGTLGGQAFYGMEANAGSGQFYLEAGYGVIRTGFSPNSQGLNVLVGYKL